MNKLVKIITDRSFVITLVLTLIYMSIGIMFIELGLADYGAVVFCMLPFSLGLVIGSMPVLKWAYLGFAAGIVVFIALLITGALEGIVCVIMALPIIIILVVLGVLLRMYLVKKGILNPPNNLKSLFLPLLFIFFAAPLEKLLYAGRTEIIEVKTERVYPYTTEQVYETIKSVDTLMAQKPFLMKLDLPIPQKCILEKEEIGGLRTCYFSGGTITERITELEKAKVLRMDVIDYKLTGRKWLGFKEAIYYFEKAGTDSCKLIRITTYTSVLKPRFYWGPLEKLGIDQEHDYVFDNLSNDLKRKYK